MRVFVPVEDAPGAASLGLLVPYRCGLACEHALRERPNPAADAPSRAATSDDRESRRAAVFDRVFPHG
jgi:hypothetical protein